ncbi:hypothetical protein IB49_05825 [Geobacillus sp. LC300]|nr:hypothetical protein IB49_05825 [Geobacillus sp. LC300]
MRREDLIAPERYNLTSEMERHAAAGPDRIALKWESEQGETKEITYGRFEPEKYLQILEKYNINVLCCTPTEYRLMAKVPDIGRYHLSHLHSAVSAGEPLNREVIDTFAKHFGVEVRDGYGQTENTLLVGVMKGMPIKHDSSLIPALQEHVKQLTAPYKYPRKIEFVDDLPKTASRKIRRVELREREARLVGRSS